MHKKSMIQCDFRSSTCA